MKAVGQFLFTIALGLVYTLAQAATLSKLWSWFVSAQYGAGPTYAVWYGASLIVGVVLIWPTMHLSKDRDTKTLTDQCAQTLGALIVLAATLGVSWCVGHLFGWL
jgi:hypothetical protein